jgi:ATP-dependent exoDNAse (exonuclease V) beta subunit
MLPNFKLFCMTLHLPSRFLLVPGVARPRSAQRRAIGFNALIFLTQVLTSRIAYLILHHLLPPSSICAVTFTNKAATEMRERLSKLIGKQRMAEVRMGTFHALCALYLRKFSRVVGIEPNFTVCDAEERCASPFCRKTFI